MNQDQGPGAALKDYTVYDQHYEKVGKVDDLFVDAHDQPEYIGVKMGGLLSSRSTLVPMELVRVNDRRQLVEIAADEETIKHAPTFHDDKDITPEYEHGVYGYFGLQPPASEQQRTSYGGYYAPDEEARRDDELDRSVDTAYGERSEPSAGTFTGGSGGTNLDVPLDDTGRDEPAAQPRQQEPAGDPFDADAATRTGGETRAGDRQGEVQVEGDRDVRVFKRNRSATR